jgi:hypothetical protein
MGMIVKNSYLPGFTQAERNGDIELYLEKRGYCKGEGTEGAEIAHIFHNRIVDEGIELLTGAKGFSNLNARKDPRNLIIASCAKSNCMSAIWWLAECECQKKWLLYSGVWNDTLGFMVLDAPHYHPVPLVWLTEAHQKMRPLLDLQSV